MDLKIICWNVQGCGDLRFLPAAKQFLRDCKPDLVVFVEPRISGRRANSVIFALSFPHSYRIEAIGFSGGIWVAWYDTVTVDIIITHFQFLHMRVMNKRIGSSMLATTIYTSPSASGRKLLWPHLRRIASSIRSPWILFGDFNATLTTADRLGCAQSSKPSDAFQNLPIDYGLREMGYQGPAYTWTRGNASVRLDMFICNSYYDEAYSESAVQHLLRMRSDHRPILLSIGSSIRNTRSAPFKYFSGWQTHDDFSRMVTDNWVVDDSMSVTL
ncbi:hypothetical protein HRI_000862300 [Hibiscus trionum]|uniref:Endonuclease/exonuclease/phosphatase domain-containing protein n=1 Tax=Hibiscus trionum TaxID=183268 RepID=A0A9W7LQQ5_HIBTR|nr:hypothetical protein HRI_000862300 [Hibiscus trionum]